MRPQGVNERPQGNVLRLSKRLGIGTLEFDTQ